MTSAPLLSFPKCPHTRKEKIEYNDDEIAAGLRTFCSASAGIFRLTNSSILLHHSRALPERNLRLRPSQTCGPIGGNRRLEVIDPCNVLDDVVAGVVPDIDSKGEVGLGLHNAAPAVFGGAGAMLLPVSGDGNIREHIWRHG